MDEIAELRRLEDKPIPNRWFWHHGPHNSLIEKKRKLIWRIAVKKRLQRNEKVLNLLKTLDDMLDGKIESSRKEEVATKVNKDISDFVQENYSKVLRPSRRSFMKKAMAGMALVMGLAGGVRGELTGEQAMNPFLQKKDVILNGASYSYQGAEGVVSSSVRLITYVDDLGKNCYFGMPSYKDGKERSVKVRYALGLFDNIMVERPQWLGASKDTEKERLYFYAKCKEIITTINPELNQDSVMSYVLVQELGRIIQDSIVYDKENDKYYGYKETKLDEIKEAVTYSRLKNSSLNEEVEKFNRFYSVLCKQVDNRSLSEESKEILKLHLGNLIMGFDKYVTINDIEKNFNKYEKMLNSLSEEIIQGKLKPVLSKYLEEYRVLYRK